MNKLIVPICNRTNYSKLQPILCRLKNSNEIEICIITSSDMAIDERANAIKDILSDGFDIRSKIDCLMANDTLESMSKTIGISLIEHSSVYSLISPKAILVVGDRFDILPAVLAARLANIPILHVQGGEKSGSIDDVIRDIITLCAERHYVSTDNAFINVEKIAKSKNIFNFGCPSVEHISNIPVGNYLDVKTFKKDYKNSFGIAPYEKYMLVLAHPNTNDEKDVDMDALLSSVLSFGIKAVVLYPNVDPFNFNIMKGIKNYHDSVIRVRHMPIEDFVKIMAHCTCMVGNSSSGIREAASFGVPVVNVGRRQENRERNKNTIDCGTGYEEIRNAIDKSIKINRYPPENIYYKKNTAQNICEDILNYLKTI